MPEPHTEALDALQTLRRTLAEMPFSTPQGDHTMLEVCDKMIGTITNLVMHHDLQMMISQMREESSP